MSVRNRNIVPLDRVRSDVLVGISKVKLYELINEGELQRVKIGRRSFVTEESLDAYRDRLIDGGAA